MQEASNQSYRSFYLSLSERLHAPFAKALISSVKITLSDLIKSAKSEAHAVRVIRVVVVDVAIIVDIAEVGRVGSVRRTKPPVVGRTA